jgi:adenylate cyclase
VGLVGFTQMAETLPAKRLGELLGQVFGALGEQVRNHRGHLAQLVGDRLFAIWNAPLRLEHHARHACLAALAMRDRLDKLRPSLKQEFSLEIRAGIGIATGEAVVGELGARESGGAEKSNYTAMGAPVSLASDLERLCRVYGVAILASESTYAAEPQDFAWREIDTVLISPRDTPIRLFELQAEKGKLEAAAAECTRLYALGLEAYTSRKFRLAYEHFRAAAQALPADGPSACMRDRCQRYIDAPPPVTLGAPDGAAPTTPTGSKPEAKAEPGKAPASDLKAAGR